LRSDVSDDGVVSVSSPALSTDLGGDDLVSVSEGSNSLGSPVESPPLSVVTWVVVLDSQSVLVGSNMLMPEEGSVSAHSSLDLELDTVSEWISWEVKWSSVDVPGLVSTVVALPPDDLVGVSVA